MSYKMNHLDKTLQVQRSTIPLGAAGIASNLLFGSSVILITLALCPQPSFGEPSFSPPNDSTEELTFNYAIANSHAHQGPSIETQTFPTSTIQNNQQSSFLLDQTEKPTSGITGLSSGDDSNQSSVDDLAQTPAHQSQSSDSEKPIAPTSIDISHGSGGTLNQGAYLPEEKTNETLDAQSQFSINSSTKLRFYPADSTEQRSQVVLARFAKVFDQTWEVPQHRKSGAYGTIPLVLNDSVEKNLEYFQYGIHERFQSYLDRFHHYQDLVEPVFRELGLPTELMYLSLVESGFNPRAFSRSRASGPWQFMKGTGRVYGLDVDWYLDERRDPIKSTVAAAHHLRDLYDQFGSWPLALGAYNAGSGKISRAIKNTGTRDFWKIRQSRHIRRETKDYVPRFIAATLIAQNPTAYGFSTPDGDRHEFEEVLITKRVHLSAVTQQTGISVEELQRLNPELRRSIVPSLTGPGYYLKVPLGMASLVEELHPTLAVWSQPPPPPTEWHTVRSGESLSVVAKRFGMKVSQLKEMNNLRSNIIRVGTKLRVRGGVDDDYADTEITWYRVRSGDSLGSIAARFRKSVDSLMRLNNLSSHIIHPGDRLRIKGEPSVSPSNKNDSKWYKVRRGDSLWTIAQQFRMSVNDLQALNNLSSSIIQAGRMLMVSQ
ncbi:LysM peptidoglycan-binding domain-containing protein [uncultured Nitrospira sp.]|uniref:lytic transglycosylase n=1 Tax=uncultured Nitrospira sp. TaxID=157176 RepID=UPI0031406CA0